MLYNILVILFAAVLFEFWKARGHGLSSTRRKQTCRVPRIVKGAWNVMFLFVFEGTACRFAHASLPFVWRVIRLSFTCHCVRTKGRLRTRILIHLHRGWRKQQYEEVRSKCIFVFLFPICTYSVNITLLWVCIWPLIHTPVCVQPKVLWVPLVGLLFLSVW